MKTPEELAEEYNKQLEQVPIMYYLPTEPCRKAFLAGYQAAKEHAHAALEEAEAEIDRLQSKLSDTGILTTEHLIDASKTVSSSETLNNWISVKDRLPEQDDEAMSVLISGDGWHDYEVAYFGPTTWHDKYDDVVEGVTHWMPLPAAPKEKA